MNVPEKMKAVVLMGPDKLEIQEVDVPVPGPADVLIKVESLALCGSDVGLIKSPFPGQPPYGEFIIGHEYSGGNQADAIISGLTVEAASWSSCRNAVERMADDSVQNIIRSTIGRWYKLSKATSPRSNDSTINEGQYTGLQIRAI